MSGAAKRIIIDGRGHLVGRLAAIVAKQLLEGQRIVVVRCEDLNISGLHIRNKFKYLRFLDKTINTNPRRAHRHYRTPAKMFWRSVRGMLPHKLPRGARALSRLRVYEGVPPPYDRLKRVVVPGALRVLRLKPMRKFTVLGELAAEVGWKHASVVSKLEERRKVKAAAWYARQKQLASLRTKATTNVADQVKDQTAALQSLHVL